MKLFPIVFSAVVAQGDINDLYTDSSDYPSPSDPVPDAIQSLSEIFDDGVVGPSGPEESFFDAPGAAGMGRGVGGLQDGTLQCNTCNESNIADCISNFVVVTCADLEFGVCSTTVRERFGAVEHIEMKCEDYRACRDNQAQNFVGTNIMHHQCKPWMNDHPNSRYVRGGSPSVCRHCCAEEKCHRAPDGSSTVIGWADPDTNTGNFPGFVDFQFGGSTANDGMMEAHYATEAHLSPDAEE